jgi:poly(glycerol-phosphate) alpha-glucosyltransferase
MHDLPQGSASLLEGVTVIELVSSISPESFGLGYAALNLAAALNRAGTNTILVSVDQENVANNACECAGFPRERLICGPLVGPSRFRFSPLLIRRLSRTPGHNRIILHMHGMWTYVSRVAGALRDLWRCPLVLSPHGSLELYALAMSSVKKMLAMRLYEQRNVMTASLLSALSNQEQESIRAFGYAGRIAIIPNGVMRAVQCSEGEIADFRIRHSIAPGMRVVLFLSRIARKKNLPLLLGTFARNLKLRPDWVLLIAGSDEDGHLREVRELVRELGIEASVRMIGSVSGKEKACAFTSAAVFALPSHSEGLPIAVLEAMEYGKPVLVTDGWALPVTTLSNFGWRVPGKEDTYGVALLDAMNRSDDELKSMGCAGRALVRENFEWDSIARQATSLYASVLAQHNKVDN